MMGNIGDDGAGLGQPVAGPRRGKTIGLGHDRPRDLRTGWTCSCARIQSCTAARRYRDFRPMRVQGGPSRRATHLASVSDVRPSSPASCSRLIQSASKFSGSCCASGWGDVIGCSVFARPPLAGASRAKQSARGGIQAEGGIETRLPIPPLVSLRMRAFWTAGQIVSAPVACPKARGFKRRAGAAVINPLKETALTSVQGCFAGYAGGGIAGAGVSGCIRATFAGALRHPVGLPPITGS